MRNRTLLFTLLSAICWLVLCIMAVMMYRERLLMDAGHYAFYTINQESFRVEHNRFVLILAELIPALLVQFHLPLTVLLIGYSLNHILFPLLITFLLHKEFPHLLWWLIIPLTSIMGLHYGWFVPQFELYYGGWLMLLMAVMLFTNRWNPGRIMGMAVLMIFIFTAHTFTTLVFPFMLLAFLFQEKKNKWWVAFGVTLAVVFINVYKRIYITDYEAMASAGATDRMSQPYWKTWNYQLWYFGFIIQQYKNALLCAGVLLFWEIRKRQWKVILTLVANFFLLSFFIWMLQTGFGEGRYQQQIFYALLLLLYIWMAFALYRFHSEQKFMLSLSVVLLIAFGMSVRKVMLNYPLYKSRVQLIQTLTHKAWQQNKAKSVFPNDRFFSLQQSRSDSEFTLPIESLLLSAEKGSAHTRSIIADIDLQFGDNASQDWRGKVLVSKDAIKDLKWLNSHYFQLDSSAYVPLDY